MRVQTVSFNCVLKNNLGQLISSSFNQDVVTNAPDASTPHLAEFIDVLKVLKNGERRKIKIPAHRAYGLYNPNLSTTLSRNEVPRGSTLKVGDVVQINEQNQQIAYRVTACSRTDLTLDANHPLAGQDLEFDVEMVSSREEFDPELVEEYPGKNSNYC